MHEKNKIWENNEQRSISATRKFDFVLRILHLSATCFLVIFFEGQVHLQFSMVESWGSEETTKVL